MNRCVAHVLTLLTVPTLVMASNGSSTIGSARVSILDEISIFSTKPRFALRNGNLIDASTESPLLQIKPLVAPEVTRLKKIMAPAILGAVSAWEFLPSKETKSETNYWMICSSKNHCAVLMPFSNSNPLVPAAVGQLEK